MTRGGGVYRGVCRGVCCGGYRGVGRPLTLDLDVSIATHQERHVSAHHRKLTDAGTPAGEGTWICRSGQVYKARLSVIQ